MKFQHLDLNLLVALDVLLAERNVTKAANFLCLSQSATSGLLSKLREFFNDDILMSQGRKMIPTPFALSIEEPVRKILLDIQQTVINKESFEPKTAKRTFRIMASDYVSSVFISKLSLEISKYSDCIKIDIITSDENYEELLSRREIDLLIHPKAFTSEQFPKQELFRDDYSCITWKHNTLILGRTMDLDLYSTLSHVVMNIGRNHIPSFEEEIIRLIGSERKIGVYSNSFCCIPFFVSDSNRIGVIPSRLAKKYLNICDLNSWPVPIDIPPLIECLQWNAIYDDDRAHQWLRDLCYSVARML